MTKKPNVILITTDQQRFDGLGINGSDFLQTPNLDKLGSNGALFKRAYCSSPVCTPSRASLLTGNHLSRHGAYNIGTRIENQYAMLSHLLRGNGYYNYHIGKAHWNPWGELNEETQEVDANGTPFQDFMGFHQAELSIGHANYGAQKSHYGHWLRENGVDPDNLGLHRLYEDDPMETGNWDIPVNMHSGAWVVNRAQEVLPKMVNKEEPFFLNLGFQDPHHPHIVPTNFQNRVEEDKLSLPHFQLEEDVVEHVRKLRDGTINESRYVGRFKVAGNGDNADWKAYFQETKKAKKTIAYYYSMIQLLDEQIGRLLRTLGELDILNNTILVFTSDHGEMLGDHGIGQKGPLIYESAVRIPLIIHYPKKIKPRTVSECVSLVDILPTITDYADIYDGMKRDGISLKPIFQDKKTLDRKGIRIEYKEEPNKIRFKCWVTDKFKLAVYLGEEYGELYDLRKDPGENKNLFYDENYKEIKIQLLLELLEDMERSEPVSDRPSRV